MRMLVSNPHIVSAARCLVSAALATTLCITTVCAESRPRTIYRSLTTSSATPHYSSHKNSTSIEATNLPTIKREASDERLQRLQNEVKVGCETRGGLDCSVKKEDGEFAQCQDGSQSQTQRYGDFCQRVRLQKKLLVEFSSEPFLKPHREVYKQLQARDTRPIIAFVLEIRNLSPTPAENVIAEITVPFLSPRKTRLVGPSRIEAFAFESYRIEYSALPAGSTARHLAEAVIQLSCGNCE